MDEVKKRYFELITLALISSLVYFNSESLRIRFQLWRVENIIKADDMGQSQDVDEIIKDLKNTTNKRHLSEIMLSQSNGSLVAEGMVVVVEEKFSDGEETLNRYAKDKRWNYWLTYNSDFPNYPFQLGRLK